MSAALSADTIECWVVLPGFPNRRVSSLGGVQRLTRDGWVDVRLNNSGPRHYQRFTICVEPGKKRTFAVHRVIAEVFLGPRPMNATLVRHLDGNRNNNNASNLAYGTESDNLRDAVRHGTHFAARKTHCPSGHPYDGPHGVRRVYANGNTARYCNACKRAQYAARKAAR